MALRRLLPVLLVLAGGLALPTTAQAGDVESQVFAMINAGRGTALALHHGLLGDAESHSQYMAQTGSLNHDNADERVNEAAPDPAEANGAPDDGFAQAAWCENATYVTPAQGDPATAIYNNWKNSPPHAACMNNTGKNVGAVGVYWDGSTYWATFVAEVDSTPPGGGSTSKGPQTQDVTNPSNPTHVSPQMPDGVTVPKPTAAPVTSSTTHYYTPVYNAPTATTAPTPKPTAQPPIAVEQDTSALLAPTNVDDAASKTADPFGLPEIAGIAAVLVLGCLFLERRMRVPKEFVRPQPIRDDFVLASRSG